MEKSFSDVAGLRKAKKVYYIVFPVGAGVFFILFILGAVYYSKNKDELGNAIIV
jgi:hypothetical protein